jgi:hypothetical protein
VPDIPSPVDCADTFDITAEASLMFPSGFVATGTFTGATLGGCSPPQGKTFSIGPSSMEGHLLIRPGDWISGGYSFKFVDGGHDASTVTVSSTLTLPFRCADGTTGQFVINLGTHDYVVPASNTNWQPTGDANNVLSWAGSGPAPAGCGPGNIMDNSRGAIFQATVSQNPDTGSLLNWRFKYRDPNAKGKGNVNCLDTTDPRRSKADVCGASWSVLGRLNETSNAHALQDRRSAWNSRSVPTAPFGPVRSGRSRPVAGRLTPAERTETKSSPRCRAPRHGRRFATARTRPPAARGRIQ